ncbi:MAG TPA: glycoside hydrolase family 15 protein [Thermoleophilaceae bacterium]|jgi:GH15 family glucan-1,4-alpha-glucosidase|nr:glycoside hydrolase family 15 protein [Thermoleophilaceae bacterium]
MDRYPPIAEHGLIGDLHTVALVGTDGTIDWYCCPNFDSPSVFAAILDAERGGHFALKPSAGDWETRQLYFPDTNVLITRFLTPEGVGEVEDFMPVGEYTAGAHRQRLIRRVVAVRGAMHFELECAPRFDYGRQRHRTTRHEHGVLFESSGNRLALETETPIELHDGDVRASFELMAGQSATFILEHVPDAYHAHGHSAEETRGLFESTVAHWRRWLSQSRYVGRWRETVHRSALTLKLLTYVPTGAIVAAPTTSLPEVLGGERNWDYRYTWIRDAAFSLYALLRLGFTDEAAAFMDWLTERVADERRQAFGPLQIMYGIDGRRELPEQQLDHLEGYRGSTPVRIGNDAAAQLQLDIYGELVDSIYLYNKHGTPISHDAWEDLRRIVEWVCDNWDQADEGIWETRGGRQHFTYSRLQCWVAVERALRIATTRGLPANRPRWEQARDRIYGQIIASGWNPSRRAFVQHYDTRVLDASLLLMPLVKFLAPTDPRWLSTLDAIGQELVSDSLVYRYNVEASPDGLRGSEGTFSMCTFWYVEALARAGRLEDARLVFEKMLTYANHLGLYAEEIGPTGEQLGNFPQAFTHLALISAAVNLDRQLG